MVTRVCDPSLALDTLSQEERVEGQAGCVEEQSLRGYLASIPCHLLSCLTLARQEGTEAQCQLGLPGGFWEPLHIFREIVQPQLTVGTARL